MKLHDTAEQAKAEAERILDEERVFAQDGWPAELVDNPICWGMVIEIATETKRQKAPAGSVLDEIVDYELKEA
ncbi:hypothetical protein EPO05_05975 [Patescibacteria group bacterium]|nr:MAG: hypothetical protein EPO05_05975 [Patescibacteria group bacterium]